MISFSVTVSPENIRIYCFLVKTPSLPGNLVVHLVPGIEIPSVYGHDWQLREITGRDLILEVEGRQLRINRDNILALDFGYIAD